MPQPTQRRRCWSKSDVWYPVRRSAEGWKAARRLAYPEVALLSHSPCSPSEREAGHEATRFHNFSRRRDGGMAARWARAAEGDAGDRRPQYRVARHVFWTVYGRVPPGTERSRLRRGTEFGDRIPL